MKFILTTLLLAISILAHASKTQIGITDLVFESNTFNVTLAKTNPELQIFNQQVLNKLGQQLKQFNPQLVTMLYSNKQIYLYNGNPLLKIWEKADPKILETIKHQEIQEVISSSEASSKSKDKPIKPLYPNDTYLLIGFVRKINAWQYSDSISQYQLKSLMYNAQIWIDYSLVEVNSKKTIARFISIGQFGNAALIPQNMNNQQIKYNSDLIATDVIKQLLNNTKKLLLKNIKLK